MQQIFNNQYVVSKKISSGSFGVVRLGYDKDTNLQVAIKIEKEENEEVKSLEREVQILERLADTDGIPKLYWHGEQDDYSVIIIQLLGKDLSYYMKSKKKFSLKTVLQLGINMLRGLERIHLKGVVHRDLKPENILLGLDEEYNKLYIVDFGISKIYRDSNGKIIPFRDKSSFIGTTRYASIAAHKGYELSRKDDLESMMYVLLYFLKGYAIYKYSKPRQLPWQNMQNVTDEERTLKVGELKMNIEAKDLCKELPVEFTMILEYIKALHYKTDPDYDLMCNLFSKAAETQQIILDDIYDWDMKASERKVSQHELLMTKSQVDLKRSATLQQQQSLQIPQGGQEMKKSIEKNHQLMRQSSNNLLAPPSGNTLQPPLKRQDSRQQTLTSAQGSMMLSTYNSMKPKYQGSYALPEPIVKLSMDSQPEQTENKFSQQMQQDKPSWNCNETVGYRDSIFDENFDDCPLSQRYNKLKGQSVKMIRPHSPHQPNPQIKRKK